MNLFCDWTVLGSGQEKSKSWKHQELEASSQGRMPRLGVGPSGKNRLVTSLAISVSPGKLIEMLVSVFISPLL